jgi:hypothetical protein
MLVPAHTTAKDPVRTLASVLSAIGTIAILMMSPSCGSTADWSGSDDGGSGGSGGPLIGGSSGGGTDASRGAASSGSGGSGGGGLGLGVGSDGSASSSDAAPQRCSPIGSTRACCNGTQTCTGTNEFPTWGPCLDSTGALAVCFVDSGVIDAGCGMTSEGKTIVCDAGIDSGPPPPPPAVCTDPTVSNEPEILVGYQPAMGQTVGLSGQIKIWVNDENSPFIAPGEMVDNTTGAVTAPGNRTATASDGLLYEPALYIAPASPTNGGTAHFPQWIKGSYNNNPPTRGTFTGGAPIDTPPPGTQSTLRYSAEFIWDVSALGLTPGTYVAVFSVHDGDHDRAIGCVTIVITP